jgi:hypothetical protein
VPDLYPHADGQLWWGAITHVMTPRLLFPEKLALDVDTERTERWTGLRLIEQGGTETAVPLGYMAESYIDFGPVGMYVPILLIGLWFGLIYRYFTSRPVNLIFAYGIAAAVLNGASQYEISGVKLLGGVLMTLIVGVVVLNFLIPSVNRWLTRRGAAR